MMCSMKDCKRETDTRCSHCLAPVCDEHSNDAQLWFTHGPVQMCYICQSKEKLLHMPRKGMRLNETLKNCLWALDSRYPRSIVDINEAILSYPDCRAGASSPVGVIAYLQDHVPQILDMPTRLVVNEQECSIYLLECSQEIPAFGISCGGWAASQRRQQNGRETVIAL